MQMPLNMGPVHILGIGGIGMSAIAEILHAKGYTVQGSDQKDSANVKRLRAKGIRVFVGHDPVNLVGARYVVISTAVKHGNPELEAARAKGLPIIRRAEMLAELMRLYATVSVTGTHGKTTTTSLIAHVFKAARPRPDRHHRRHHQRLGLQRAPRRRPVDDRGGRRIRRHLHQDPDPDRRRHQHRPRAPRLLRDRRQHAPGVRGLLPQHPVLRPRRRLHRPSRGERLIERLQLRRDGRRLLTYGTTPGCRPRPEVGARGGRQDRVRRRARPARARRRSARLSGWSVPLPGHHNALNALAAIAAASEAGIADDAIRRRWPASPASSAASSSPAPGTASPIYDDYGHHPVEIAAVLKAARAGARGRVIAVVEPHRYTRVRDLFDEFAASFADADSVIVAPLYSAGEPPIDGIDHARAGRGHPRQRAQGRRRRRQRARHRAACCRRFAASGDMVVCLGAGNSTEWAHALPAWLAERAALRMRGAL